jgi:hypothetical protein
MLSAFSLDVFVFDHDGIALADAFSQTQEVSGRCTRGCKFVSLYDGKSYARLTHGCRFGNSDSEVPPKHHATT